VIKDSFENTCDILMSEIELASKSKAEASKEIFLHFFIEEKIRFLHVDQVIKPIQVV